MLLFDLDRELFEAWSQKYKRSINCDRPRGFSQRAHCQGRKKNEDLELVNEKKKRKKNKAASAGAYNWYGYYYGNTENSTDAGGGIEESATVFETFDQPYSLKWEKSEHGDYDALATLDDGTYLTIMFNNEYKKNWMVEFYRNNSQAVTGEGDAQRIFATVLTAIRQFIQKKKPQSLFFSAVKEDDPSGSRTKLYDRLVQRYAGNLGYSVQRQEHPGQLAYKLIRNNQTNENFADGKKPGRRGLAKRSGVNCKQSVTKLRKIAKNSSGERQRMAHWCANMKSGKQKVNEGLDYSKLHSALNDFLPLAMQELNLDKLPKIYLRKKINHGGQPSFGSFSSNGIELGIEDRHPVDVCRTLAHELVHYKQGTKNQLNHESGRTGSPEENQANSLAGIIMRKFSKEFPNHIG